MEVMREIKTLQDLDHPNVIKLLDTFHHNSNINLVLEFMDTDLSKIIRDPSKIMTIADRKAYFKMCLEGVKYCHENWLLHRDIKPENFLVNSRGVLKLSDFGLAKLYGSPKRKMSPQACTLLVVRGIRVNKIIITHLSNYPSNTIHLQINLT